MLVSFGKGNEGGPAQRARGAFLNGRLQEAERGYREVLAGEPENVDALHMLGVICFRLGRGEEGEAFLRRAAQRDGEGSGSGGRASAVEAMADLGEVLRVMGKLDEAEVWCRRAAEAGLAAGALNLAKVLGEQGRVAEAVTAGREAIARAPHQADGYAAVGAILLHQGRVLEAARNANPSTAPAQRTDLETYRQSAAYLEEAVRRNPQAVATCLQLATVYERLEYIERAYQVHKHVVELRPHDAEVVLGMAYLLVRMGWLDEAERYLVRGLELAPHQRAAREQYAALLIGRGKYAQALEVADQLVAEFPVARDLEATRADALMRLGRFDEAIDAVKRALADKPSGVLYQALSNAQLRRGDPAAALAAIDQAMALEPQNAFMPFNRGIILMLLGRYAEAWPCLEWRWRNGTVRGRTRQLACSRWEGQPLNGGRIVLLAEQGLGDTVQWVRYAPLVAARGGKPVIVCQQPLVELLKGARAVAGVVPEGGEVGEAAAWLPLMSLPGVFHTTLETVPAEVPYLSVDPEKVARWKEALAGYGGIKVGLVWEGGSAHPENYLRSAPLAAFAPLGAVAGVTFFSLQKGPAAEEVKASPAGLSIVDLSPRIGDFSDTAAILENLDLLISVDTAVVHVAGALGRPVWTLLAYSPSYLWMFDRGDTPWYPTMRLFRQPAFGDWVSLMAHVRGELERLVSDRRKP